MDNAAGVSTDFLGNNSEEDIPLRQPNPLDRLLQGDQVFMKINPKSMLVYIMDNLGSTMSPIFSETNCGNNLVKVSIKLDVSQLRSASEERIMYSVVVGEASSNVQVSESSAISKAFTLLELKHKVKITDFSSRMIDRYKSSGIYDLVSQGFGLVHKMFSEWESTLQHLEDVAVKVISNHLSDTIGVKPSDSGNLYALVGDVLCDRISQVKAKSDEAREVLNKVHNGFKHYENTWAHAGRREHNSIFFHDVDFTSQDMLEFAMEYLGLDEPEFSNGPDDNGMVISSVVMRFPEMMNYQFSGNLKITAKAYTSIEANKESAFEALVFIEKNFPVQIIDFNYLQRKETLKQLNDLVGLLTRTIHVLATLRMIWSKIDNVLECQSGLFKFDPSSIFPGEGGQNLKEAYLYCANELASAKQYSSARFANCAPEIEDSEKLAWKLFLLKNKFGI